MATPVYYGKYRAKVVDIKDPEKRGRIRVMCPKVLGDAKSAWCETCVPVAGDNDGDFCLPTIGESVWIEFEEGDADRPVLTGGWYSSEKSPKSNYDDASNERIISFKGAKISMRSDQCTIITQDSSVTLKDDHVLVCTDGFQPEGDPIPPPISKVKADIGKDNIEFSVDDGQVKANIRKDDIELNFKDAVKLTLKENKVIVEVQGISCEFTESSLTTLKSLIGG